MLRNDGGRTVGWHPGRRRARLEPSLKTRREALRGPSASRLEPYGAPVVPTSPAVRRWLAEGTRRPRPCPSFAGVFPKKAHGPTEIMPRLPCSKPMKDNDALAGRRLRLQTRRPSRSKDAQMRGVATMKEFEDA
ncbi:hypothetical protein [Azospirillum palustre]